MHNIKQWLPWVFRIIISLLFLLSAVAKLYPSPSIGIALFEIKQLLPVGIDECYVFYFSRFLIATEIAIGIAILQPHFLKRFVIPFSTLMLLVFSIHLTYTIFSSGNAGNCGCFGELIPMSPLQALIKNIIGIGMLVYLFFNCSDREKGKNSFTLLSSLYIGIALLTFILLPFCPCSCNSDSTGNEEEVIIDESLYDVSTGNVVPLKDTTANNSDTLIKIPVEIGPKPKRSIYRKHVRHIDEGKKLLCFFAPGCDHCREAVRDIYKLSKKIKDFPKVYIIFMNEEPEKIPAFFNYAGRKYSHKKMDIGKFYNVFGVKDTPGVVYLWNGNIMASFDGINENKFTVSKLNEALKKK